MRNYQPVSGTSVGRITLRICSMDWRSGLSPPCIVKIFSSIIAAIGRQLKQSVNVFHNLMLYRRLPKRNRLVRMLPDVTEKQAYIRHRSHKFCWCLHIRGYRGGWKSFQDIWSYMRAIGIWSPTTAFHDLHNHRGKDSLPPVENLHTQITVIDHNTAHVYRLDVGFIGNVR